MISIVTATYKRSQNINTLAKSLADQDSNDFEWVIIIDDDSDEEITLYKKVINNIIATFPKMKVKYYFKVNGGKHTCINIAIPKCEGDYIFIVDDDDKLANNAISEISNNIVKYDNDSISSFWFTQQDNLGNIIGKNFPKDVMIDDYVDVLVNSGGLGDKKAVYKKEIRKNYTYPEFNGEKFLGESTLHIKINDNYSCVFINNPIYISEYLEGGLTDLGVVNRLSNPNGGLTNSIVFLNSPKINFKVRVKKSILADAYAMKLNLGYLNLVKMINTKKVTNILIMTLCFPVAFWFIKKNES